MPTVSNNLKHSDEQTVNVNILWSSAWALALSVQGLIVTVLAFSFIPIKVNDFVKTLMPIYWEQVRPEREMLFFVLFIGYAVLIQLVLMLVWRTAITESTLTHRLRRFFAVDILWLGLQGFAVFKIIMFNNPSWARGLLYFAIAGSVLTKIFWPEVKQWLLKFNETVTDRPLSKRWKLLADIAVVMLIVALLGIPNITTLAGHIFAWDNFFHVDAFVMAPGWAKLNGLVINRDLTSNYNVWIPTLWAFIAKITGGFNYEHVLKVLVWGGIIYYVAFYFFLRAWVSSLLLSVFGVLLAIKLQMFHWGIMPIAWRYPSATALRHFFDVILLMTLARHAFNGSLGMLWASSAVCGLLLAYSLDVGVYATVAFSAYVLLLLICPDTRGTLFKSMLDLRRCIGLLVLPWLVGFSLFWVAFGQEVFNPQVWANMTEFSRMFLQGWAALPVTNVLKDKQFYAFIMGFVVPAVYLLTFMLIGAFRVAGVIGVRHNFMIFITIYGLGLFHYFIYRSGTTSYYAVGIPFVIVICYWVNIILQRISQRWRRVSLLALSAGTLMGLMGTYLFTFYPNIFNLARFDFSNEVKIYRESFEVSKDAQLIRQLTNPAEPVALISSQEVRLLMEAGRKPFFYYFPLIHSVPLASNRMPETDIITVDRMKRTLAQLDAQKPARIFMEKKLYGVQIPPAYTANYQTILILRQYVQTHYEPEAEGQYVIALKRNK